MNRDDLRTGAAALDVTLSDDQLDRFEEFEEAIYAANEVMNMTRVAREECVSRHFLDSLLMARFCPPGTTVLDIGTGPGLPAWPLACGLDDIEVDAIDSSSKFIGFLEKQVLPNLRAFQIRAEESDVREAYDIVTGRAVAPLLIHLELAAPACRIGGLVVPMRSAHDDVSQADSFARRLGLERTDTVTATIPGTDIPRQFPLYRKVRFTPARFPRLWADIRRAPGEVSKSEPDFRSEEDYSPDDDQGY